MNRGDSVIVQGFPPEAGRSDEGVDTLLLLSNQFPARNFTIVGVFDALAEYGDRIAILASRDFVDDLRRWCSNFPFWTTSIGDFLKNFVALSSIRWGSPWFLEVNFDG